MHDLDLSKKGEASSGFVKRSDYLLFAIITQEHAYCCGIADRTVTPQNLTRFGRSCVKIVHLNWPESIESKVLRRVKGDVLTDEQKKDFWWKITNHAAELGGNAVAPLGGGTMADGSSLACRWMAQKLLNEIVSHQACFDTQPSDHANTHWRTKALGKAGEMEFELVLLAGLNPSDELIDSLREDQCLSRDLYRMGFAVVERTTRSPIVQSCLTGVGE